MEQQNKPLVSVIIPTYNRFKFLLNAIESVKQQTYKNIEIVVVNDCSTEPEYKTHHWEGINIIHLPKNSRQVKGFPCVGYVRNQGIKNSKGEYIAFLDDDDSFLPTKIETQINGMIENNVQICSTDAYNGHGMYDSSKQYRALNDQIYKTYILKKIKETTWPKFILPKHINGHNFMINSSVVVHRDLYKKIGNIDECHIKQAEDYKYWKRCIKVTKGLYINEPLTFYDNSHGGGHKW